MRFLIIFLLIVIRFSVSAQDKKEHIDIFARVQSKESTKGFVKLHQDSAVTNLINKYMNFCDIAKGFPGYRIRIYSNSGNTAREQAGSVRNKFEAAYPEMDAYLQYNNPNFEIVVGDFRSKSEALKSLKALQKEYPSAFLIKTLISFPRL